MPEITTTSELREAIRLLEIEQKTEGARLKEQVRIAYESLRPANLIGSTIKELAVLPDLKGDLLNAALGLAAGTLSKKAVVGDTGNPIKQLLGTFLQMGIASLVTKNADSIKSFGSELLSRLLNPKEKI
jgi:hypothetical protein